MNDPNDRTIKAFNRHHKQMCPSPFVVWFRERSGSTFLCSMLKSHPEIFCRYEDFDLYPIEHRADPNSQIEALEFYQKLFYRRLKAFGKIFEDATPEQSITQLRKLLSQPYTACGFKFKYEIQVAAYPEIVDELHWISRSLKVLFLTRHNVLKQAVSRQNMERIQQQGQTSNLRSKKSLPPLELDVKRAIKYASFVRAQDARFEKSVSRFHNVFKICYEDLQGDPRRIMEEALRFLNVDPDFELSSRFEKATPDRLSQAIANFSELADEVADTEFESLLD